MIYQVNLNAVLSNKNVLTLCQGIWHLTINLPIYTNKIRHPNDGVFPERQHS